MPVVKRTVVKDLNADLLTEQLAPLSSLIESILYAGFEATGSGGYTPNAATKEIASGNDPGRGGKFSITAEPGELHLTVARPLTAAELTQLDGILSGHDATQFTAEQVRVTQDATELTELRDLYDLPTMNNTQKDRALKITMRAILREQRADAI